jgi:hypothetical protein
VPVEQPDVFVVPMMASDHVLGLPWIQSRNAEIACSKDLLCLGMLVGNSGYEQTITLLHQGDASAEDAAFEPPPAVYVQCIGATAFNNQMRSSQPAPSNLTRTRLLGASTMLEGASLDN